VDADAAERIGEALSDAERAIRTLADVELTALWQRTLWLVLGSACHARIRGQATRWLFDAGQDVDLDRLLSRALSVPEPDLAAAWLQGFLTGSGYVLVLRPDIYQRIDGWLTALPESAFEIALPALRKTFSGFSSDVRSRLATALTSSPAEISPHIQTSGGDSAVRSGLMDWIGPSTCEGKADEAVTTAR
jgi:hypothetical protein